MSRNIFSKEERKVDCTLGRGAQHVQECGRLDAACPGAENATVAAAWRESRGCRSKRRPGGCAGEAILRQQEVLKGLGTGEREAGGEGGRCT